MKVKIIRDAHLCVVPIEHLIGKVFDVVEILKDGRIKINYKLHDGFSEYDMCLLPSECQKVED